MIKQKILILLLTSFTATAQVQRISQLTRKHLLKPESNWNLTYAEISKAHERIRFLIKKNIKRAGLKDSRFKSLLKRRDSKNLKDEVLKILKDSKIKNLGHINDLMRGRLEFDSLEEVKKMFGHLLKRYPKSRYILPYTTYEDYPRYHFFLKDQKTGLQYELQLGTIYSGHLQNKVLVNVSSHPVLKGSYDLHSLWFKRLSRINDNSIRQEYKLDFFESHYDELLVATGEGKPRNFRQRCKDLAKEMKSIIDNISRTHPELLK